MRGAIVGVDVGGTNIKLGVFSVNGELLEKWEIPSRLEKNGDYILEDICNEINTHVDKNMLIGVGIGLPGPVTKEGEVLGCVNLGWGTFNIEEKLSEMLDGTKVKAGNDGTLAALGEKWKGSGKSFENMFFVTLGTGVGGGVIVDGRLVFGSNGAAGEIGHMPVAIGEDFPYTCTCGKSGCLDQVSSATAIVRAAKDFPTAKDVFDAAKEGNEVAMWAVDRAARYLGIAIASISSVTNPRLVIIGGGLSKAGDFLLNKIQKNFVENAFLPCRDVEFRLASLGNDAGIYGAASLILRGW